jgi:hypothetical protein
VRQLPGRDDQRARAGLGRLRLSTQAAIWRQHAQPRARGASSTADSGAGLTELSSAEAAGRRACFLEAENESENENGTGDGCWAVGKCWRGPRGSNLVQAGKGTRISGVAEMLGET